MVARSLKLGLLLVLLASATIGAVARDLAIDGVSIALGSERQTVLSRLEKQFVLSGVSDTPGYFLISRQPGPEFEPIGEVQFDGDEVVRVGTIRTLSSRQEGVEQAFMLFHGELARALARAGSAARLAANVQHVGDRVIRTVIADFPGQRVSLLFSMAAREPADEVIATIQHSILAR